MHTRPTAVPTSISDGQWAVVANLVAALPDEALAGSVGMATGQVRHARTRTAYDAALMLLLAATEEQGRRIDPSGDPARVRVSATARVGVVLSEVEASRTAR